MDSKVRALDFNMTTKRKTTTKEVATKSMRTMQPANDIIKMKSSSPKPSLIPTPILHNSFNTTPLLNSSRLPIILEKSFEDIISEFNEKFQKIDKGFDPLEINFNNYTTTEKTTNLSENLANIVIELNETTLALRSEYVQLLEKIRLLQTNYPPNNDSTKQQNISYQIPVLSSFSTLRNMDNHEDTTVLAENSLSEGFQLNEWMKFTKIKSKEKGKPTTQTDLIAYLITYLIATQISPRSPPNKNSTHKYITFNYSTQIILPAP